MFNELQVKAMLKGQEIKVKGIEFLSDEKGEFVGSLGFWAIGATLLVIIHGAITGWLPTFLSNLFGKLDTL